MLRTVNGVRLNVLDEGEGHALLLLHGLSGSWRDWEPQLDSLSDRFRVIVPEHRGHGRSERTTGAYSTRLFADDALAVLDLLGEEHAYVVGLSMGGMIAQRLTLLAPERVDALVLCDTGAYMPEPVSHLLLDFAAQARDGKLPDPRGSIAGAEGAWAPATIRANPKVVRDNLRESQGTDPDALYRAAVAITQHDTRSELGRITSPTLLVWGADDKMVPIDHAGPLRAGIPHAELVELPDAGHVCNLEQPARFDDTVTAFLAKHPCTR